MGRRVTSSTAKFYGIELEKDPDGNLGIDLSGVARGTDITLKTGAQTVSFAPQTHKTRITPSLGDFTIGKGYFGGEIDLPQCFGFAALPPAILWIAPFNIAARLGKPLGFQDTVTAMAALNDFHGRDAAPLADRPDPGVNVTYREALYKHFNEIAERTENRETLWFIPPAEILTGAAPDGTEIIIPNNLYVLRQYLPVFSADALPLWSCTENPDHAREILTIDANGEKRWLKSINRDNPANSPRARCLPVALEFV